MLDDFFSFLDPVIDVHEGDTAPLGLPVEAFLDFSEKNGAKRTNKLPEEHAITVPLTLALSLLRPDELEKWRKYTAFYRATYLQE